MSPSNLRGLKVAAFVADSLAKSKSKDWIVGRLNGDRQLVEMWISFVYHNSWIDKDNEQKWILTHKGRKWISGLVKSFLAGMLVLAAKATELEPAGMFL